MKCYIHANERKAISKNKFRHKIFASCRKFTQIYRTFSKMSVNSDAIMWYERIFSVPLWTISSVKSRNITHPAVKLLWKSSHHWLTGNLGYLANCYLTLSSPALQSYINWPWPRETEVPFFKKVISYSFVPIPPLKTPVVY